MKLALLFASAALFAAPALAQDEPPPVEVDVVGDGVQELTAIAVPAMPVAGGALNNRYFHRRGSATASSRMVKIPNGPRGS